MKNMQKISWRIVWPAFIATVIFSVVIFFAGGFTINGLVEHNLDDAEATI